MLVTIIRELLAQRGKVVLPALGGFVKTAHEAQFDTTSNTALPSGFRIEWDESLKYDDSDLVAYVAAYNKISLDEAQEEVDHFINRLQDSVRETGHFQIEGIGTLTADPLFGYLFHQEGTEILSEATFGLPELTLQPVREPEEVAEIKLDASDESEPISSWDLPEPEAEKPAPTPEPEPEAPKKKKAEAPATEPEPKKKSNLALIILGVTIPLLIAIAAVLYMGVFGTHKKKEVAHTEEAHGSAEASHAEATSAPEEPAGTPAPKAEPAPVAEAPKSAPAPKAEVSGKIYLVVGSFGNADNAAKKVKELKAKGISAKILAQGGDNKLNRVYVDVASNDAEAAQKIEALKAQHEDVIKFKMP